MELIVDMDVLRDAKDRMLTMDEYIYLFYGVQHIEIDLSINMPKLVRLGYMDKDLDFTESCLEIVPDGIIVRTEKFEEFWNEYPLNDGVFNYPKTRTLRTNKGATKKEYDKQSSVYGEDCIIEGLRREVEDRLSSSTKRNSFTFMKSSLNYLKEMKFMDYA